MSWREDGPDRKGREAVGESVTVAYRGASYEVGRGPGFYGIWAAGMARSQPLEWWPETPEGWYSAWTRFTAIEAPGTIVQVGQPVARAAGQRDRAAIAVTLLAVGAALGIIGLFPSYLAGVSLAREPAELVPHVIYLAVWGASAVLILLGGARQRAGALLATGLSIVTFGFFFADFGTVLAGGAHLAGAGLWLALTGWLACAAGSAVAFGIQPAGTLARPLGRTAGPTLALSLTALAALATAITFAPSWDSYTLRTAAGATQSLTAGNAFANPAPVIAGNVLVMVTLVAVVVAAVLWRPVYAGAALLAGAVIPMVAQAISAFAGVGEAASPAQFGISSAQAARIGLSISSGLTPVFWIYCVFVVALIVAFVRMLIPRPEAGPSPAAAAATLPPAGTYTGTYR